VTAMSAYVLERPVWRHFRPSYLTRAAAHVRGGGHAAIVDRAGPVELLLTVGEGGKITELGQWSLLAIEQQRWRRVKDGPAKGLARARVREDFEGSVLDWCERDSIHPGPTRTLRLDCLECAACCHDSKVLLDEADFDRFRKAGRADLLGRAYVRRARDGKVTLRFIERPPILRGKGAPSGTPCQHLGSDRKCGIYAIRPDNCSVFVVGSEACLAAREETLGLRDGVPTER
jgi:uncharacterized protein